jgi:hypothetical protein
MFYNLRLHLFHRSFLFSSILGVPASNIKFPCHEKPTLFDLMDLWNYLGSNHFKQV